MSSGDGSKPRSTDASYSITHASGTATKTVNQTTGGGTWVSLGTYSFTEGISSSVSLSDKAATGTTVLADAVKLVRNNSADTDNEKRDFAFTYDANGNQTRIDDRSPGARFGTYGVAYDAENRIDTVKEIVGTDASAPAKHETSFTYDTNSKPASRTHKTDGTCRSATQRQRRTRNAPRKTNATKVMWKMTSASARNWPTPAPAPGRGWWRWMSR